MRAFSPPVPDSRVATAFSKEAAAGNLNRFETGLAVTEKRYKNSRLFCQTDRLAMPKDNPYRPFQPKAEQARLMPDISGNTINGLGEAGKRAPRMVYWAPNPDDIPHGNLQRWFYSVDPDNPHLGKARQERARVTDVPMPELSDRPARRHPQDWLRTLDRFVDEGHCEMIGVARMSRDWIFEGADVKQSRIIIVGVQHDFKQITTAPEATAGAEVVRQYGRAAASAKRIAGWLIEQGWPAEAITGPMTGDVTLIPPALACGFGELGKHGSIINPEFGASFRLSGVLTDAPIAETPPRTFGIDEFCHNCRICEDACPPEAIGPDKQTVRGTEKWYVDFDRCLPFFNETHGCAICIAACPWSRPGVGLNLAAKLQRRARRKSES